jgi:acetyltransferase-like isoleucine patch superfamily enzyme
MIRYILLYLLYIKQKIYNIGRVKYNGFAIYFAFKGSKINIQDNVVINSGSMSNLLGLYQRTIIIARYGGVIEIGRNTGISGSTIYSMKKISIGDNSIIGANCKIIDNDFHPIDFRKRLEEKSIDIKKKSIIIGENCFIGMNSIILKGTIIGNNCAVGAGSVVCGIFPDNVIIAGNPAKIIKYVK